CLESGEVSELEALARWRHPERGVISPGDFIPSAEETGMIVPLGLSAMREAAEQICLLRRQFSALADPSLAVNVSSKQLGRREIVDEMQEILDETGIDPRWLKLELTESAIMTSGAHVSATLNKLRSMNLRLHLDDFGTGYSSLGYLHRMPIDALK